MHNTRTSARLEEEAFLHLRWAVEAIQDDTVVLQGVQHVQRGHGKAAGVLRVRDGIANYFFEENLRRFNNKQEKAELKENNFETDADEANFKTRERRLKAHALSEPRVSS